MEACNQYLLMPHTHGPSCPLTQVKKKVGGGKRYQAALKAKVWGAGLIVCGHALRNGGHTAVGMRVRGDMCLATSSGLGALVQL